MNWGAYEVGFPLVNGELSQNPHPFGQVPCLLHGESVIFESGAILQYIHNFAGNKQTRKYTPAQEAAIASWIVWANASLHPICFPDKQNGMNGFAEPKDTGLNKRPPNQKMDQLDELLQDKAFLLGGYDQFSMADVAVASYLLLVLQFFPDVDLTPWPNVMRYMKDCASRPAYAEAFGGRMQDFCLQTLGYRNAAVLYGHPSTRSPLINWGCLEVDFAIEMGDLKRNPHPFGQVPCLADKDGEVVLFESGAILQYIHDQTKTKWQLSPGDAAQVSSWITWANASLEPICFLESPDGTVDDTGLNFPNSQKRLDRLDQTLSRQDYLLPTKFTLADVAVSSYLLFTLKFFPEKVDLSRWPNIIRYITECASRPSYAQAFGPETQEELLEQLDRYRISTKKKTTNAGGSSASRSSRNSDAAAAAAAASGPFSPPPAPKGGPKYSPFGSSSPGGVPSPPPPGGPSKSPSGGSARKSSTPSSSSSSSSAGPPRKSAPGRPSSVRPF